MLINPFTPSEIASGPDDFFGRTQELRALETALPQGSIAIQGVIGIGKSSLLARGRLLMEGFDSKYASKSTMAVGDKDIKTVDDAARLLLESFVQIDERHKTIKFKLGPIFEMESAEICRNFSEGRHLAVLKRIVEREYLDSFLTNNELLLLAVDEADKCPVPLARLIRAISTHTQHQGVKRVRFILAGVSPYFQEMVNEDRGVGRFFYKTITLKPMPPDEATELMEDKLTLVADKASEERIDLRIDPDIISRVVALSGGHPHILQLLGSHLIMHENEDPDSTIDARDLVSSLTRVCYQDRARVYDSTIHMLELDGRKEALDYLLELSLPGFPTRIDRMLAEDGLDKEELKWFVDHEILCVVTQAEYGLVDEFLRVRFMLDRTESTADQKDMEKAIIGDVSLERYLETTIDIEDGEASMDASGIDAESEDGVDFDGDDDEDNHDEP